MLRRKTPLKANPQKQREWQERSRIKAAKNAQTKPRSTLKKGVFKTQRSSDRAREESTYSTRAKAFLSLHRVCPVTGDSTDQVHHAAKRDGQWLLLERHWIALSAEGHAWVEANKKEAEKKNLMVRIFLTYHEYVDRLLKAGITDLQRPVFYQPDTPEQTNLLVNET